MSEWHKIGDEETSVDPGDRGFQYGDGLFETIAIREGKARLWRYHVERLERGCERLDLNPPAPAVLETSIEAALSGSSVDTSNCVAKIIVTAGVGERGYGRSSAEGTSVWVGIFPATAQQPDSYRRGVSVMMCKTRLAVGSPVAGIKTLNRIEQVLARSECVREGVTEGLVRDAEGRVICGTMSNVFIVSDRQVMTPSLQRCGVAGVMRQKLLDELERIGTPAHVTDLFEADLADADEIFITNSQMGALPVHGCGSQRWAVGPVTRQAMQLLADCGVTECRL